MWICECAWVSRISFYLTCLLSSARYFGFCFHFFFSSSLLLWLTLSFCSSVKHSLLRLVLLELFAIIIPYYTPSNQEESSVCAHCTRARVRVTIINKHHLILLVSDSLFSKRCLYWQAPNTYSTCSEKWGIRRINVDLFLLSYYVHNESVFVQQTVWNHTSIFNLINNYFTCFDDCI